MKTAPIIIFVIVVIIGLVLSEPVYKRSSDDNKEIDNNEKPQYDEEQAQPCKCMNWRNCHGKINSDVQCPQSYIFVCCVIPKTKVNLDDDNIQVIEI